ncbi:kelch-like protein 17 [Gigaspora margarita]|uniref:Kelch-like protein 17 n=1 Tax=Gigaspora margarita TaxID=4874 RepID=A0A8H4AIZ4_GIGMA|nr:kelch-like protein 17 [Gigaspora margarita]
MLDIVICNNAFNNLKKKSLEAFNKNCRDFLRQDPIKLLHFINRHEAFNELKKVSLEIICKNTELLFNSGEFLSLEKDVLALILKSDNLDMKESEIWKQLIKWGVAKHPTFQNDVKNFTSNDFETLEKTLHELIQFVRFHQINGEEFMLEVWPFRHLLPDNLIEDIFRCYLVSNAVPLYHAFPIREGNISIKIDSNIISHKIIAQLFAKWINKKTIDDKISSEFQYKFNLLFRSSRDGLSSQTFHQKCDHKGATIVIAKISNSNMLVGGYNPLDWYGNASWKNTTDSFIFSINDPNNLQSAKLGRVTNSSYAVYCHNGYGPTFGGGHDLYGPNGNTSWQRNTNSYPDIGTPNSFIISDYEVFRIVMN